MYLKHSFGVRNNRTAHRGAHAPLQCHHCPCTTGASRDNLVWGSTSCKKRRDKRRTWRAL